MIGQTSSVLSQTCTCITQRQMPAVVNVNPSSNSNRNDTYPSPPFSPKCNSKNSRRDAPPPSSELGECTLPVFEYEVLKFFFMASIDTLEEGRKVYIISTWVVTYETYTSHVMLL